MSLSVAEALDALANATKHQEGVPPDTYGIHELANKLGIANATISRIMSGWLEDGSARRVTYRKLRLDGRATTVTAFQLVRPVAVTRRKR